MRPEIVAGVRDELSAGELFRKGLKQRPCSGCGVAGLPGTDATPVDTAADALLARFPTPVELVQPTDPARSNTRLKSTNDLSAGTAGRRVLRSLLIVLFRP
jgi:hypothetical protein